jgi:hypothetical protein
MDLRTYYQKMRKIEADIPEENAVIVSVETSDGGTPGRTTEVKRELAARMLVEGRARIATEQEAAEFRGEQSRAYEQARRREGAGLHAGVLSEQDLKAIRNTLRPGKQD